MAKPKDAAQHKRRRPVRRTEYREKRKAARAFKRLTIADAEEDEATGNFNEDTETLVEEDDDVSTTTIPTQLWREKLEEARRGNMYKDNYDQMMMAKDSIRDNEYEIRKSLYDGIRGLRRMLRIEGYTDIDPAIVREHAKDVEEEAEGAGRDRYGGETQDFKHLKELRKQMEDKSDQINDEEMAFERSFRNI